MAGRQGFQVLDTLEGIFEIAFTADTEKQDRTKIGYAVSVQRHGYSIEILDAWRILNFKRELVQS